MDFGDFLERMKRVNTFSGTRAGDLKVRIKVCSPGGLGATPTVEVKSVMRGIDWDSGSFLITPEKPLTVLTDEQLEAVKKVAKDAQSYESYAYNKKLKAENAALAKENKRLSEELALLKACYKVDSGTVSTPLPPITVDIPVGVAFEPVVPKPENTPASPYTTKVSLFATKNGKPIT